MKTRTGIHTLYVNIFSCLYSKPVCLFASESALKHAQKVIYKKRSKIIYKRWLARSRSFKLYIGPLNKIYEQLIIIQV